MKFLHPINPDEVRANLNTMRYAMKKIHTVFAAVIVALTLSLFSFGCTAHNSMDTMSSQDTMQSTHDGSMKDMGMKKTMPDTMKSTYIGNGVFVDPGSAGGGM